MTHKLPLKVESDTSPHVARVRRLVKSIWRRIPEDDQSLLLRDIKSSSNSVQRLTVVISCDWQRHLRTNGYIWPEMHYIIVDGGYIHAADDKHISSLLAHELGHLRGYVNPAGPDISEETANHFQMNVWGFPEGEVIYKCEVCRCMEEILHREGISGQILWHSYWNVFVWLPPDKCLTLGQMNYKLLLEEFPSYAIELLLLGFLEHPLLAAHKKKRFSFQKSARFKRIRESLDTIERLYMSDED